MRKAALVLSVVAAAPAALFGVSAAASAAFGGALGATGGCGGKGGCSTAANEPAVALFTVVFILVFATLAAGSVAGGLLTLRRPWAGAVVLLTVGVLGAGTILFFVLPLWTPFDLAAGALAVVAALRRPHVVGPQTGA